ncbi:MAG: hypothetical protein EBR15_00665 [Gammaproteobacteria bacterium]|nr:hypothetical protein [Gammaproteobacteria bacterium]
MHSLLTTGQLVVLAPALVAAAVNDVRTGRIANRLVAFVAITGLFAQYVEHGWQGTYTGVSAAALGFACLLPMYLMRGMAAGDVKLMAATGTWLSVPLNFRTRSSAILVAATDIPFGTSIEARHLASVGVATFNALHADAVEELPRVADHALALAKRAGKDRYVISSRASAAEVVRSL